MNDKEKLKMTKWDPISGLAENCYIYSVSDDENGFKVVLVEYDNETRRVHITFPFGVRAYSATDELLSINALQVENDEPPSGRSWCLFKVTNSEYLKWASKRSDGISDHRGLIHFAICTLDMTLEILNHAEPKVEFVEIKG